MKYIKVTIPSGRGAGKTYVAKQVCGTTDEYRVIAQGVGDVSAEELAKALRTSELRTNLIKSAQAA